MLSQALIVLVALALLCLIAKLVKTSLGLRQLRLSLLTVSYSSTALNRYDQRRTG